MAAVRRSFEGLARGDLEAATADFAPTVEIDDRDIPDADGHDSYYEWIGRWNESWASWRIEDLELRPSGEDKVVALFRIIATGRGSGVERARRRLPGRVPRRQGGPDRLLQRPTAGPGSRRAVGVAPR
jgi:hypothetical protein